LAAAILKLARDELGRSAAGRRAVELADRQFRRAPAVRQFAERLGEAWRP
jgi:hypothetical protein